jgi:hypothetical protein
MIDCPQRGRAAWGARGWLALLATRGGKPHLRLAEALTGTLPPEWPAPPAASLAQARMLLGARASRPCPRWTTWAPVIPRGDEAPSPWPSVIDRSRKALAVADLSRSMISTS